MRTGDPGSVDAGAPGPAGGAGAADDPALRVGPGPMTRLHLPIAGEVRLAWAPSSAVPEGDAWLTPAEAAILSRFRVSKRAADWRLGRWVAKAAVAQALEGSAASGTVGSPAHPLSPAAIEVLAGPGGGPRVRVLAPGAWPSVSVSLSHSVGLGFAVAAVGGGENMRIGCDIEEVAPRSEEFVSDYLTEEEGAWVRAGAVPQEGAAGPADARAVRANLLWSAKESALKAMGEGLRKDTRSVVVRVEELDASRVSRDVETWRPLTVETATGDRFAGWWRVAEGFVWTLVG